VLRSLQCDEHAGHVQQDATITGSSLVHACLELIAKKDAAIERPTNANDGLAAAAADV